MFLQQGLFQEIFFHSPGHCTPCGGLGNVLNCQSVSLIQSQKHMREVGNGTLGMVISIMLKRQASPNIHETDGTSERIAPPFAPK